MAIAVGIMVLLCGAVILAIFLRELFITHQTLPCFIFMLCGLIVMIVGGIIMSKNGDQSSTHTNTPTCKSN